MTGREADVAAAAANGESRGAARMTGRTRMTQLLALVDTDPGVRGRCPTYRVPSVWPMADVVAKG
eukprot:1636459-Prymnesium_polylepis.1